MKITIEGASEGFERKLLALLAEHRHELTVTAGTEWTVDRAETYLVSLPAAARQFAQQVVYADGMKDADELRQVFGSLRGPTIALSRAITRGVREDWWPQGTPAPITVMYDPDNPSWQKAVAYTMTSENVPIFRNALDRLTSASAGTWAGEAPSALAPAAGSGWSAEDDVPRALDILDEDEDR
ncbi:hypothetical protein OH738_40950 (plasmid) [Streptomyces hirsutus]|uniref:hypothetical protein n=1 Tax=Streptomyces hirsutus TaxID=35620 RepID=UPI002F90F098|nr:hypothetical protein OH738_40950 [Streptomyces hirsutus]